MMGALSAFSMSNYFLSSSKSVPDYTVAILPCVTRENKEKQSMQSFPFLEIIQQILSGNMFNGL